MCIHVSCACVCFQDDIIDDVNSFVAVAQLLKDRGAYKVYVMATHGILSADAPHLIDNSLIDEVNTILHYAPVCWNILVYIRAIRLVSSEDI